MKEKKPSRRSINRILGQDYGGYNDKRKNHNRIKLWSRLTPSQVFKLVTKLPEMHPTFKFTVEDFLWKPACAPAGYGLVVTVIRYSEI